MVRPKTKMRIDKARKNSQIPRQRPRSSGVEHSLGKGEAGGSIPPVGTMTSMTHRNGAGPRIQIGPKFHLRSRGAPLNRRGEGVGMDAPDSGST